MVFKCRCSVKRWNEWLKFTLIWMVNVSIIFLYDIFLYITEDISTEGYSGQVLNYIYYGNKPTKHLESEPLLYKLNKFKPNF